MLEHLVSSKVRRTLFEYLLTHPQDRFYLRGLAKDLGLSVSPLRRELKRLELTGMLKAEQEGNMLFYTVEASSSAFLQLKGAGSPAPLLAPSAVEQVPIPGPRIEPSPVVPVAQPAPSPVAASGARSSVRACSRSAASSRWCWESARRLWRSLRRRPASPPASP